MTNPYHITLQKIRDAKPCSGGWTKLLTALGNPPLETVISLGDVAVSNNAADALWCARCIDDRRAVVALVMPAVKRASAHTTDQRVHDCIAALDLWVAGDDKVDLNAAAEAAEAAGAWAAAAAWAWIAAEAARAAWLAERNLQVTDIIGVAPPLWLVQEDGR